MTENNKVSLENDNNIQFNRNLRGYVIFWIGQLISLLGSSVVQFSIVWWITVETGSELFLALSTFLGFGPTMLLTPIAGVFVDRWSRKKIIATVDFFQAIATMGLIFAFILGIADIWFVLAIITLRGVFQAFHRPAVQAIIPLLIPKDKLSRMNGLDYLFNGMILMVGPLVGALLLNYFILQEVLWLDAITFMIAIVPTIIISIPSVKAPSIIKEKTPFLAELSEGFTFIRNQQGLLALLAVFTAANFFMRPLYVLLPLFVKDIHLGGPEELALLFSALQAGMICSSMIMSSWKGFENNAHGVALGIFIMYFGFIVCSFVPQSLFPLLILGIFLNGFGLPIANVSSQTIWQKIVPPEKLGRVYSVRLTIAQGSGPIAIILSGIFGELFGIIPVLVIASLFGMLFLGYSLFFTRFRYVEKTVTTVETPSILPVTIEPHPVTE
ncbi:MAG: MFS transporter [Candidatus Heimdallarchaeota archaeon]|nr:MAG: MFS transporter [Candidatus Heimdallarchaeota archaeon]